jgi:hypothetical protein
LRVASGRGRAAIVAFVAAILVLTSQGPTATNAHAPGIDRFLYALGQVESSGSYTAENPVSGAYGKYQIMPANWGPWALRYIGSSSAPQTSRNQEIVARAKVHDLHHWLARWNRVAYWWLTGSSKTSGWSDYARRYVSRVMAIYNRTGTITSTAGLTRYTENSSRIAYGGRWIRAEHGSYMGDAVRQARRKGQSATFTFSGSQVAWNGPKGPTRGKARIYVDGDYVRTVDLYASRFRARNRMFTKAFADPGRHSLKIVVAGTLGRPVVAIDEFLVWD